MAFFSSLFWEIFFLNCFVKGSSAPGSCTEPIDMTNIHNLGHGATTVPRGIAPALHACQASDGEVCSLTDPSTWCCNLDLHHCVR